MAAASSLGLAWFAASLFGLSPVSYPVPWAPIGAALFMSVNLALLLAAIGRIRSSQFAGNRRAGTRLPLRLPARVDGRPSRLLDLSLTGARLLIDASHEARRARVTLTLDLAGETVELASEVRRRVAGPDRTIELGLEFGPGQEETIARLAVAVFQAGSGHIRSGLETDDIAQPMERVVA